MVGRHSPQHSPSGATDYAVQYVDGLACLPRTVDAIIIEPARYTFTAIWILLGSVTPLVV